MNTIPKFIRKTITNILDIKIRNNIAIKVIKNTLIIIAMELFTEHIIDSNQYHLFKYYFSLLIQVSLTLLNQQ